MASPPGAMVQVTDPVEVASHSWVQIGQVSITPVGTFRVLVDAEVTGGECNLALMADGSVISLQSVFINPGMHMTVNLDATFSDVSEVALVAKMAGTDPCTVLSADMNFFLLTPANPDAVFVDVIKSFPGNIDCTMSIGTTEPTIISVLEDHLNDVQKFTTQFGSLPP